MTNIAKFIDYNIVFHFCCGKLIALSDIYPTGDRYFPNGNMKAKYRENNMIFFKLSGKIFCKVYYETCDDIFNPKHLMDVENVVMYDDDGVEILYNNKMMKKYIILY